MTYELKNNYGNFRDRMNRRLERNFPLTFYQRWKYPIFCIIILNDKNINIEAKYQFIEQFVKRYISDKTFRENCIGKKPSFCQGHYMGCMSCEERCKYTENYRREHKLKTLSEIDFFYVPFESNRLRDHVCW